METARKPRIRIEDLPALAKLSAEELARITGAGRPSYRPSIEHLERRELPALASLSGSLAVSYSLPANTQVQVQVVDLYKSQNSVAVSHAAVVQDPIWARYDATATQRDAVSGKLVKDILGQQTSGIVAIPGGSVVHFQGGDIFRMGVDLQAHVVYGPIRDKWISMGSEKSALGYPTNDVVVEGSGYRVDFQGGTIYWSSSTGAHALLPMIRDKFDALNKSGIYLGMPTTDTLTTTDGIGRYALFQGGGSIYWSASTGAHEVHGDLRAKWAALGSEKSALGYPTSDVIVEGGGYRVNFQGGTIYWSAATGSHALLGAVRDKFDALNLAGTYLGMPTTDTTVASDGVGRYADFQSGSIYWTSGTGAHEIHGAIRDKWVSMGRERSSLGYPTSDETSADGNRVSNFQNGYITFTKANGQVVVNGFSLSQAIVTSGATALGGSANVTVTMDGTIRFWGHVHDSGAEGYDFQIRAVVRGDSNFPLVMQKSGHVGGTFSSGSRDFDWDETFHSDAVAAHFSSFKANPHLDVFESHDGSFTGPLKDIGGVAGAALRWVGGALAITPGVGFVIFAGAELGSLATTGSLAPGARIVGSTLWLAGPYGTLYSMAAEGISAIGTQERMLSENEYNWAQFEVFHGSLPPREKIVLTDIIGGGGRAFTFPRFDGKITLNMGPDAFADARKYGITSKINYGEVFIPSFP